MAAILDFVPIGFEAKYMEALKKIFDGLTNYKTTSNRYKIFQATSEPK
jgi:hypothetical protein